MRWTDSRTKIRQSLGPKSDKAPEGRGLASNVFLVHYLGEISSETPTFLRRLRVTTTVMVRIP